MLASRQAQVAFVGGRRITHIAHPVQHVSTRRASGRVLTRSNAGQGAHYKS